MLNKTRILKGIAVAAAALSSVCIWGNTSQTDFTDVTLYSPVAKSYFSFRNMNLEEAQLPEEPGHGKVRFPAWIKAHNSQLADMSAVSEINLRLRLVDDKDRNGCISNNDYVLISDPNSDAYLTSVLWGYYGHQHKINHQFKRNPQTKTPYKIVGLNKQCIGSVPDAKFKLESTINRQKRYPTTCRRADEAFYCWEWNYVTITAKGETLTDGQGNTEFQFSTIGNPNNNQEPLPTIQSHVTNEAVAILSHRSTFMSGDAGSYLPTINGANDKWEILGVNPGTVLRHYCIPDGTLVKLKNHGNKLFLAQDGWTFNMQQQGSEFIIENQKYPGGCIEPKDAFSLKLPDGNYVQISKNHYRMTYAEDFHYKSMTFAYARNPDLDFQVNKANLTLEVRDSLMNHKVPAHDGELIHPSGSVNEVFAIDEDKLKAHPIGVAMQYSFHSRKNSFCDDTAFFIKKTRATTEAKFLGTQGDGMEGWGSPLHNNRPHVLAWESFRFDYRGDDDEKCFSSDWHLHPVVQANGTKLGFVPSWNNRTNQGNSMRLWNPDDDQLGSLGTTNYYLRSVNTIDELPEWQGLIDVPVPTEVRFYFSDAEGGQNYKTELAVTGLQAHDGRNVLAINEGGDNVGAYGQILQTWESLTFESANRLQGNCFRNNDEIYIRTNNGHVIKANEYDHTVDSRTHNRITWEKFTIEKLDYNSQGCLEHGSKIKLRTFHGTYLKAVNGDLIHTPGGDDDTAVFKLKLSNAEIR